MTATARPSIIPSWAKSVDGIYAVFRAKFDAIAWWCFYHGTRAVFKYPWCLLALSPLGAVKAIVEWWHWVRDHDGREEIRARRAAGGKGAAGSAMHKRDQRIRHRAWETLTALVATPAALLTVGTLVWWPIPIALVAAGLMILGWVGRPEGIQVIGSAADSRKEPTLNDQLVARALTAAGRTDLRKLIADEGPKCLDITSQRTVNNRGVRLEIDLPAGTARDIVSKTDDFVGRLRRTSNQVTVEADSDYPARLVVTVLDRPPVKEDIPRWELPETVDAFGEIKIGTRPGGEPVTVSFMWAMVLFGAIARSGKSWAIRLIISTLALDPRVELMIFELKATGDYSRLRKLCLAYHSGKSTEDLAGTIANLQYLEQEMDRRLDLIGKASESESHAHLAPDNKITPELAARGMRLIVCVVDEFHELTTRPEYAAEFDRIASRVTRFGQTVGILLILATQKPSSRVMATDLRDQFGIRVALRLGSQPANDMVLMDGAHSDGFRATAFGKDDVGKAWVRIDEEPELVQFDTMTGDDVAVCVRNIMARRAAYRGPDKVLSGHGAGAVSPGGSAPDSDTTPFVDIVLSLWPPDKPERLSSVIAADLAAHDADSWGDITPADVTGQLPNCDTRRKRINGIRGYALRRDDLEQLQESH